MSKEPFKKEKPLEEAAHSGCLNCPSKPIEARLDMMLAVGFGSVEVRKDDTTVWAGDDPEKTLQEFEDLAAKEPDADWRVKFNAPLWDGVWQRQAPGKWYLIEKGRGFA